MRADVLLVKQNLAPTRTRAQDMIKGGQVSVVISGSKKVVTKPSEDYPEDTQFEVASGFASEFVSRAGHKIKGATDLLQLVYQGKDCLDVGVSTGGFSEFLLKMGAHSVLGIDVGQDQTHAHVRNHPNFTLLEKTNARSLDSNEEFQKHVPKMGFDFICMDVSFISVKLILPQLVSVLKNTGDILVLIKPQFELGPDALNEKGVVEDESLYQGLEKSMIQFAESLNFKVKKYFSSSIAGKDGNKEFFLFLGKNSS
ncbi:MAG: TlyA family RNA methyltransferase [Bdellovibrionaceae bacterium]|nr:TlyA family RNA methyltransferase [Pseudobdellovibrionaceae bacterium]